MHHRRDRHRHDAVRDRAAPRVVGRALPRQRSVGRQTPLRQDPRRLEVAGLRARGGRHGRDPCQGPLPRSPIPTAQAAPRTQARPRRGQTHDDLRDLAHALHRRDLPRPRRRLLHQPRPRTPNPTPRRPARTPRTQRHAHRGGRGSLNQLFLPGESGSAPAAPLRCSNHACACQRCARCWDWVGEHTPAMAGTRCVWGCAPLLPRAAKNHGERTAAIRQAEADVGGSEVRNAIMATLVALFALTGAAQAATVPVQSLAPPFRASNPSVTKTPDGVHFGVYADSARTSGSLGYDGANGTTFGSLTALGYTYNYNTSDNNPLGSPYLRVFLDADGDGSADHDVIFDPTLCATLTPPENTDHVVDVTTQTVRYDDDSCSGPATQQPFAAVKATHASETIVGIFVT